MTGRTFIELTKEQMALCEGPEIAMNLQLARVTTRDGATWKVLVHSGRQICYAEWHLDILFASDDIASIEILDGSRNSIDMEAWHERR